MLLICEGPCNADLQLLEGDISEFRARVDEGMQNAAVPPDKLVKRLRALKHTEHVQTGQYYSCSVCGAVRIF